MYNSHSHLTQTTYGVRDFTNGMDDILVYIGKVGLGYLDIFHDAEIETTDGYQFNEGNRNTSNAVIEYLYDLIFRFEQHNPAHMVINTLMNSTYGKTIIQPLGTCIIVTYNEEYV